MARWLTIGASLGAGLVVVAAGAVTVAAWQFDPASQKPRIVEAVRRATGRPLRIDGPMRVGWGLEPVLEAEDVALGNMPGGSRPDMVTVARMEARVRLLPMLAGWVEIASVTLVRPDILLETDAAGRGNWQFDRPAAAPATAGPASSSPGLRMSAQLDSLRIEGGRLGWRDGATGKVASADVAHATLDLQGGPIRVLAQGSSGDVPLQGEATLGTWPQVTGASPGAWPLVVHAAVGGATLALDGQADPAKRSVTGHVSFTVPDLARLGMLAGVSGLPPLHDLHGEATLPGAGEWPSDVTLQAGAADLGGYMAGAALTQLALTWPKGEAARLAASGTLDRQPWQVAARLTPAGRALAVRGLSVSSPLGDLAGDLALSLSPRPAMRGTLVSNRIDADAIRALRRATAATTPAPAAGPAPAAPAQAAPARLFSDQPLPFDRLKWADADLGLTLGTLRWNGAELRNGTAHLVLQDGVLRLDPAGIQTPAGRIDLSASADANPPEPPVALALRSAAVSVDGALQAAGLPGGSDATMELDVALQAAGRSPHALAASLTGHAGLALVDGELSNAVLAVLLADVTKGIGASLDPGGRTRVRCLALRADAQKGTVTVTALKLDTSRLALDGSGTVDLGTETVALHLRPVVRLGAAGIAAPVRMDGPLRHPAVALDPVASTGRTGVTIGSLVSASDNCAPELAAARDGRSGRLPAEAGPAKAPRAADLLRGLLR